LAYNNCLPPPPHPPRLAGHLLPEGEGETPSPFGRGLG